MEKKENQRIILTKRLLKEALLGLMEEKSIRHISVSELCQKAGINRSTFYNHYGSQFDLLREIELDTLCELEEMWKKKSKQPNWTMRDRAVALCRFIEEHRKLSVLLFANNDLSEMMNSPHMKYIYEERLVKIEDERTQYMVKTFFENGIYSILRTWILDDIPMTSVEMGELLYEFCIGGFEKYFK